MLARRGDLWQNEQAMYGHVIITGASSGFGMAFARRLVGECAHMVLVARRKEVLIELADELRSANSSLRVTVIDCDLASQRARERLVQTIDALPEGKTLLINNAGLAFQLIVDCSINRKYILSKYNYIFFSIKCQ